MDKIGHLVMTKSLSGNIHRAHKAALLFGSILPDLLVYTYLEGHTWEATFEQITKQMKALEAKGRGGSFSYLKLGWILHYVEDYFTYPHNTNSRTLCLREKNDKVDAGGSFRADVSAEL